MDNEQFVTRLNRILTDGRLSLPALAGDATPSPDVVAAWAAFLRECVKHGIHISDPRWSQLSIVRESGAMRFVLDAPQVGTPDDDFVVGLQLLMGMLGRGER